MDWNKHKNINSMVVVCRGFFKGYCVGGVKYGTICCYCIVPSQHTTEIALSMVNLGNVLEEALVARS